MIRKSVFSQVARAALTVPPRKVFISYSHLNQIEADRFVQQFGGPNSILMMKTVGVSDQDDFIDSPNPAYVLQRIRDQYIQDSTVTLVLIGRCTHGRRYVDWEINASLQQGEGELPNGLIAIQLPSCPDGVFLPPRLEKNWSPDDQNSYARVWHYPPTDEYLREWIEDAYNARTTRAHLISNSQDMMKSDACCRVCGFTH
jgi:hypothetical protein